MPEEDEGETTNQKAEIVVKIQQMPSTARTQSALLSIMPAPNPPHILHQPDAPVMRYIVLITAVVLIGAASWITLTGVSLLTCAWYNGLQTAVCLIFTIYVIANAVMSPSPWRNLLHHILFLFTALPYLPVVTLLGYTPPDDVYFMLHFLPLTAAAIALSYETGRLCRGKINGMFITYTTIVTISVFTASLIFFQRESGLNPKLTSFPMALWWSGMQTTTVGAPLSPLTVTGKALAFILSAMGMMMFPLFTVYISNWIKKHSRQKGPMPEKN